MLRIHHWPVPMIRFHRALLIVATVGVAVAASRVATDASDVGSWLLTAAFALLLLVADLAREVEEAAGSLADSSGQSREAARRDIYGPAPGGDLHNFVRGSCTYRRICCGVQVGRH